MDHSRGARNVCIVNARITVNIATKK